MCQTASQLRAEWYATAPIIYNTADLYRVELSNEYHAKKEAYKNHRRHCPECRAEMRAMMTEQEMTKWEKLR
jgi:formate dehydrogenase maturation protein FdhE